MNQSWLTQNLQPAFTAINVEPEDIVDEEIDTTRDIQVEESLKLFQHALKLHAQGPRFFDGAPSANTTLFKPKIYTYPEAKTEFKQNEAGQNGAPPIEPAYATV